MSLSDNPFVFFARCGTNKIAHVSIHHPFAKEELLAKSKSVKLKALGRACLGPAIFNINEPVIFGCVAWNPIMMLPMWIIGAVIPAITWIACKVIAFAPIPRIQFDLWYCPYPISTFISTQGSIGGIILVVITFLVAGAIWYPFFKAYEKQCLEEEAAAE